MESNHIELPASPTFLSTGDFNNDGIQDIAVVVNDKILFLINDGNGQFNNWSDIDIAYSGILISGDFNNDGLIDVIGLEKDYEKRKVGFIKNLGNGNFEKIKFLRIQLRL